MRSLVLSLLVLSGCSMGLADPALVTASLQFPTQGQADGGLPLADDGGRGAVEDAGTVEAGDAGAPTPPDAGVDAGVDPCATLSCPANGARCDRALARCICGPGFSGDGTTCTPVAPGSPESRTSNEVCTAWRAAEVRREPGDGFTTSTATCDPGTLSRDALDDALLRLNFFRWLVGLGPTTDDAQANATGQACAVIAAWNPAGQQAHSPQPSATCYTQAGAGGAGSSNIAWGAGDARNAIDLWIIDSGNESTFGHRRWLLNPPLNPVGIGHYRGGNNYGTASCISVFGGSGTGPQPAFVAFPPPGFSPTALTQWPWTIHGSIPLSGAAVTVTRVADGVAMPVHLGALSGGYGQPALLVVREGWSPVEGQTYHVRLSGSGGPGSIEYDVTPTGCP